MDDDDKTQSTQAIIDEAVKRRRYALDYDDDNRREQRFDIAFCYKPGAQWDDADRNNRKIDGAPALEYNQLPQFVNQVVNDQRQRRPGIKLFPAGDAATVEMAKLRQGVIRGIESASRAESVYDSAFRDAVVGGRGFCRIVADYESDTSFDQVLSIRRIADPLSVLFDPDYSEPDASDANWCFVDECVTREEFSRRWPDAEAINWDNDRLSEWFDGDHVVVADYLRRVEVPRVLCLLADGSRVYQEDVPEGAIVVRRRAVSTHRVEWYKLAGGSQILETYEWRGSYLPVFVCIGDDLIIDGKRQYQGLIRRARDAQRMYNYAQSAVAERIALAPKAPWIMAEGQDEGYEQQWAAANKARYSRLVYKPTSVNGQLAPPPQRQIPVQAEVGLMEFAQSSKIDLRATIGMYENSLGMRGAETSGRAILAREQQGDNATFHFPDNLSRMIALIGRAINELIPVYYDTPRMLATIGDDDTRDLVAINRPVAGGMAVENSMLDGEFAVISEAAPSYATRRQEQADSMMKLLQAVPGVGAVAPDLIVKSLDFADADVLAERLKLMLPPQIQQADAAKQNKQPQIPPEIMAQVQQMQQALQQMQAQGQQLMAENAKLKEGHAAKLQEQRMEDEAALLKAAMDNATKLVLEAQRAAPAPAAVVAPDVAPEVAPAMTVEQQMAAIAGLTEQVMAMGQQLAAAVMAPRTTTLQTDAMGNPVGAVSVPATMQ